jgi:mRNA deadenylase 3'-5' endonuclease subunit Ccr4
VLIWEGDLLNHKDFHQVQNCYEDYRVYTQKPEWKLPKDNWFPPFTNYKRNFKATLDHIFYSSKFLRLENLRLMPTKRMFEAEGLVGCPNQIFPSDHLPIGAVFSYRKLKLPKTGPPHKKSD